MRLRGEGSIHAHRREAIQLLGASAVAIALPSFAGAAPAQTPSTRHYRVPLDHFSPRGATIEVQFIVVDAFERARPTVFVVGDGQQFHIRPDVLAGYRAMFGPGVNIVGLPGRGLSKDLLAYLGPPGSVDWARAYQLLRYEQWVHDADRLRQFLLGPAGKILLYGVSGGGRLAHEYMTLHGRNVSGVYTQSAVFQPLEAELGIQADKFWRELPDEEKALLQRALATRRGQADLYAQLLQRQNYFVNLAELAAERRKLVAAIAADDQAALKGYSERYQVAALAALMDSPQAYRIRVREYELVEPQLRSGGARAAFLPDRVVSSMWARPLLEALAAGRIPRPVVWTSNLNACSADALVVSGRYDHVADYRVAIALASHYPNHKLVLLDDDHQLHGTGASQKTLLNNLIAGWTKGFGSAEFERALAAVQPLRWREDG